MSTSWHLHCADCDERSESIYTHAILADVLAAAPHLQAAQQATTTGYLEFHLMAHGTSIVAFAVETHPGHDLRIINEYGETVEEWRTHVSHGRARIARATEETTMTTYTLPEYALSEDEGRAAYEQLRPAIEALGPGDEPIVLDMSCCKVLCTHWLSGFYRPLFEHCPIAEVERAIRVQGASRTNQQAVDIMYAATRKYAAQNTPVAPWCCYISCGKTAEWTIHSGSDPYNVSEACSDHVGRRR